jgi:hypothetical protein
MLYTGAELNRETNEIQLISKNKWSKLKNEYYDDAKEHYKRCAYPEYNLWRRLYPEDAKKSDHKCFLILSFSAVQVVAM